MNKLEFLGDDASFRLQNPEQISYLYFPLASEAGLKSAITPNLGGDSKLDQETFLLEPVSAENLHALAPDANWLPGQRFGGSASQEEVAAWVEELELLQ